MRDVQEVTQRPAEDVVRRLHDKGILAGLPIGRYDAARSRQLLVTVTELNTRAAIDRLARELGGL